MPLYIISSQGVVCKSASSTGRARPLEKQISALLNQNLHFSGSSDDLYPPMSEKPWSTLTSKGKTTVLLCIGPWWAVPTPDAKALWDTISSGP